MIAMVSALSICLGSAMAQVDDSDEDEEIFELSPFTVEGTTQDGYRATHTLAGTRIKTELKDVGAAISVVTEQFMDDIGATDNETLLSYTLNTEVGGGRGTYGGFGNGSSLSEEGTFSNPNGNTRVRGLTSADNTRNYFLSDIPWDGYVVDRVDMVRGPNAVLFGLGSPAGVINAGIAEATFEDSSNVELNFGSWGSTRLSMKLNRVLIEDELAIKVAALRDNEKFRQDPAYDNDERIFIAAKYAPRFLQSESSSLTLQGHFESGRIRSNRPRWLAPNDRITPFFNPRLEPGTDLEDLQFPYAAGMDRTLVHPWGAGDVAGNYDFGNGEHFVGEGSKTSRVDGVDIPNPYWMPVLGNFGQVWGHPVVVYGDANSSDVNRVFQMSVDSQYSINTDGVVDTTKNISIPYNTLKAINGFSSYAHSALLPFEETGAFKEQMLTDRSIFDFRNNLIDGPNKREESDFDTLYLSLSHTFMDGRFGYDLSYFNQDRTEYSTSNVGNTLYIDVNSHLQDLSVNPNAGRPYTESIFDWGTGQSDRKRDSMRATAFARHDFQDNGQDGWLPRLLGRHTVTGLWAKETSDTDFRSPLPYVLAGGYHDYSNPKNVTRNSPGFRIIHYMGDPINSRESAAGANIPATKAVQLPPSQMNILTFDSHWNAPGVDPAATWTIPWTRDLDTNQSQQAYNPENYVGWVNMPADIIEVAGSGMENDYVSNASLSSSEIESEALVWQGHFWDGAVVGTYGWRKDTPVTKSFKAQPTYGQHVNGEFEADGFVNVGPDRIVYRENVPGKNDLVAEAYNLNFPGTEIPGQTQTASLAVHMNKLIGDRLPFNLSLYYNTSENFQPLAGRVDMYGNVLAPPSGDTEDFAMLIATKDNKYSLKVTRYETSLKTSNLSSGINPWFIQNLVKAGTWEAKVAYHNLGGDLSGSWTEANIKEDGQYWWEDANWNYHGPWNDTVIDGELVANYDHGPDIEVAAVTDWFAMIKELDPGYLNAWGMVNIDDKLSKPEAYEPAGLTFTEDSISKGTEFEFTMQPNDQLRLTINARRGEASRSNVGGEALSDFVSFIDKWFALEYDDEGNRIYNAGDIRQWWKQDGNTETMRQQYVANFRRQYALTKLFEGQANPEMAKWSYNIVGTYSFKDGFLDGVYVGGGYRWTDKKVIGYGLKYVDDEGATLDVADLPDYEASHGRRPTALTDFDNTYYSDVEDAVDVWFGRNMKLNDKIDWRIQVNIRDLLQDGEMIPLTVQPNGDVAAARIPGSTEWTISNNFSF